MYVGTIDGVADDIETNSLDLAVAWGKLMSPSHSYSMRVSVDYDDEPGYPGFTVDYVRGTPVAVHGADGRDLSRLLEGFRWAGKASATKSGPWLRGAVPITPTPS